MRFVTFAAPDEPARPRLGALHGGAVIDLAVAGAWAREARRLPAGAAPDALIELLRAGPEAWAYARRLLNALEGEDPLRLKSAVGQPAGWDVEQAVFFPPLPRPSSVRDFYAFEDHVLRSHAVRGKPVPAEWYQFPVFYFSNAGAIFGPGEAIPYPADSQALDYELEVACVIGVGGQDIPAEKAAGHVFGYTIFNDWSARDLQQAEMRVGLGPAKGKDFATSLGPWIATPDELAERAAGRPGVYDLQMIARVNGQERSRGNWKDLHYSFGEMIARASANAALLPGDVIASGTVGGGCLLELTRGAGPWLQPGDAVALEIECLGILENRVVRRLAAGWDGPQAIAPSGG